MRNVHGVAVSLVIGSRGVAVSLVRNGNGHGVAVSRTVRTLYKNEVDGGNDDDGASDEDFVLYFPLFTVQTGIAEMARRPGSGSGRPFGSTTDR